MRAGEDARRVRMGLNERVTQGCLEQCRLQRGEMAAVSNR